MINARLDDRDRVPGDSESSGFRELLRQCRERTVRPLSESVSRMMEKESSSSAGVRRIKAVLE